MLRTSTLASNHIISLRHVKGQGSFYISYLLFKKKEISCATSLFHLNLDLVSSVILRENRFKGSDEMYIECILHPRLNLCEETR